MAELIIPCAGIAASVRASAYGHDRDQHGAYVGVGEIGDAQLAAWVAELIADTREGSPRPEGFVPSTHLWWTERQTYLGRLQIRHRLTSFLRESGGHIGYYVVPTARRRGHATKMLSAALPVAAALGIECALLTCDVDNSASRKTIEANGGLFQDQRGEKLRYWLPTA